ncbi:hypothetical protein Golob_021390, partial [Gossypium lobatum]|nr:hypothetical protein [Gossypium lobatum]
MKTPTGQQEIDSNIQFSGNCCLLNIDGAVKLNTDIIFVGVLQKLNGECIIGYDHYYYLGVCLVFETELRGILDDLVVLQRQGLNRVLIQIDNLQVVKLIQESQSASANSSLVRRVLQLLKLVGYWRIRQYVPREENRVVDSSAKMASDKKKDVRIFEEVPEKLLHLLEFDIEKNAF